MIYDLSLSRGEFERANRLVRSVLLQSKQRRSQVSNYLHCATSNIELLAEENQEYVLSNPEVLGASFAHDSRFDIWLSPAYYVVDNDIYIDTLLHELCHGYLGVSTTCYHNQRWKRFFGRVLHHYHLVVRPLDLDMLRTTMLKRYTKQGADENYVKYLNRIDLELDTLDKIASQEYLDVLFTYHQLTARESK